MIDIRPFVANDMRQVMIAGIKEVGVNPLSDKQDMQINEDREANGQCRTCLINGKVVGCGGIDLMWPGVGEVWVALSNDISAITAYRGIAKGLKRVMKDNDLWRVQGWARVVFKEAHALFQHLGMEEEGVARKYTPDGVDCVLYSKVRNVTSN